MNDNSPSADLDRNVEGAVASPDKRLKLAIIVVLLAVVAYVGGNGMRNAWVLQRQIECSRCMQRIADGLRVYNFDAKTTRVSPIVFLRQKGVEDRWLICPRQRGQESNYVVLGAKSDDPDAEKKIVIYEPLANHDGKGANVLYADGHAQFVKPERFQELIATTGASE